MSSLCQMIPKFPGCVGARAGARIPASPCPVQGRLTRFNDWASFRRVPGAYPVLRVRGSHETDARGSVTEKSSTAVASLTSNLQAQSEEGKPSHGASGGEVTGAESRSPSQSTDKFVEERTQLGQDSHSSTESTVAQGSALVAALVLGTIASVTGLAFVYKEELNAALVFFSDYIEGSGPAGYLLFLFGYAALEVLAIPAIPITMSAGLLFGPLVGTALVSTSGTIAATVAFLISRYVARDKILKMVEDNPKFLAIDRAIGENSFRVVTVLRLSPLLPFSLGNYVYGLTSVKLVPYILGSWLGMLPGTYAYVAAGSLGRTLLQAQGVEEGLQDSSAWTLAFGLVATLAAAAYVTNLAKNAVKDIDG
eukprot:TRINITY_DN4242_c0_g1_i1.p1 TRINITY_DN4242_c0_g1~~TRINITY_DN4242_c0_g1_i1.p1  ORF type:complete len:366 (+),score=50.44 TRINITY_DN4242_c0_g1_i1:184-1281(+)